MSTARELAQKYVHETLISNWSNEGWYKVTRASAVDLFLSGWNAREREIQIMRKALEFYANENHWGCHGYEDEGRRYMYSESPGGATAHIALKKIKGL